jgi:hypothetical protein
MLAQRTIEEYQRFAKEAQISLLVPNVEFGTEGTDFSQVERLIEESYLRTRAFLQGGGLTAEGAVVPGIHVMLPQRRSTVVSLAQ